MEPVGLAIGVVSLYSVSAKILDRVHDFKDFGIEAQTTFARFEASKLRLQNWAKALGICDGKLAEHYDHRLDDPQTVVVIQNILRWSTKAFEKIDGARETFKLPLRQRSAGLDGWVVPDDNLRSGVELPQKFSKKGRLAWASGGKAKLEKDVDNFERLVNILSDVVPPRDPEAGSVIKSLDPLVEINLETLSKLAAAQKHRDADMWLDASKSDDQYEDYVAARMPGTCEWILNHAAWALWESQQHADNGLRILWINAPAGFGKSILSASLIQHIRAAPEVALAYCFSASHSQNNRNLEEILRTWLTQLHRKDQAILTTISEMRQIQNTRRASKKDLWTLLEKVATCSQNCILVLDGLDEYPNVDDSRRHFLARLKGTARATSLRILLTSRREFDIESELGSQSIHWPKGSSFTHDSPQDNAKAICCPILVDTDCEHQTIPPNSSVSGVESTIGLLDSHECSVIDCKISKDDLGDDIDLVSQSIVDRKLPKQNDLLRQELALEMADRCDGQFLWLKLQQDLLRDSKSAKALRNIVQSMPEKLHSIYERSWDSIQTLQEPDRTRAVDTLRWVTYAFGTLTVQELAEALVVSLDSDSVGFSTDDIPANIDEEYINGEIKTLCGSLIELREDSQQRGPAFSVVHLVHASVGEFLLTKLPLPCIAGEPLRGKDSSAAHDAYMAAHCIRFLDCSEVWKSLVESPLAFTAYAANEWMWHLDSSREHHDSIGNFINHFMSFGNVNFDRWEKYHLGKKSAKWTAAGPFYWACLSGLISVMESLHTDDTIDINSVGGKYGTSLNAVISTGNTEAFERLVSWNAELTTQGDDFDDAITTAAYYNRYELLKTMLKDGRHSDSLGLEKHRAIKVAAERGYPDIVRLLLDSGGDVNPSERYHELYSHTSTRRVRFATPVTAAAAHGHLDIVRVLLEHGADPNIPDVDGDAALHCAIDRTHPEIASLLLQYGADCHMQGKEWAPLHLAAWKGLLDTTVQLVRQGAQLDSRAKHQYTPLHRAAQAGHVQVVRYLLEKGASANTQDDEGCTPLSWAAENGNLETVVALVDAGVQKDLSDEHGQTPLHYAVLEKRLEVSRYLIQQGITLQSTHRLLSPLHLAAWVGDLEITKTLLEYGMAINDQDDQGETPLDCAVYKGHNEIVERLLRKGAAMTSDIKGFTPLHRAARQGSVGLMKLLIDFGADPNVRSIHGYTPLHKVARATVNADGEKCIAASTLLYERGAVMTPAEDEECTPLHDAAVDRGRLGVMTVLLDGSEPINVQSQDGYTPLYMATYFGNVGVVELLIRRGAYVDIADKYGLTPFHRAVARNSDEIVNLLIRSGAEMDTVDRYGMTCRKWLRRSRPHFEVSKGTDDNSPGPDLAISRKTLLECVANVKSTPLDLVTTDLVEEYEDLAHCCLLLGLEDDARIACLQQVLCEQDLEGENSALVCTACAKSQGVAASFFVCKLCLNTGLCGSCMEGYGSTVTLNSCRGHEFLRIVASEANFPLSDIESLHQWLDKLVERSMRIGSSEATAMHSEELRPSNS